MSVSYPWAGPEALPTKRGTLIVMIVKVIVIVRIVVIVIVRV